MPERSMSRPDEPERTREPDKTRRHQCTSVALDGDRPVRCDGEVEGYWVILERNGERRRVLSTFCGPCAQARLDADARNARSRFESGQPVTKSTVRKAFDAGDSVEGDYDGPTSQEASQG